MFQPIEPNPIKFNLEFLDGGILEDAVATFHALRLSGSSSPPFSRGVGRCIRRILATCDLGVTMRIATSPTLPNDGSLPRSEFEA